MSWELISHSLATNRFGFKIDDGGGQDTATEPQ